MRRIDNTLYTKIFCMARNCAASVGIDRSYAADITQEVCIALIVKILKGENEDSIENFDGYLYITVLHKTIDLWNRMHKEAKAIMNFDELIEKFHEVDTELLMNQAKSFSMIVDDMIAKHPRFTEQDKKVWALFKLQIYSCAEMAAKLNLTLNAFYVAKKRLIDKIIKVYGKKPNFKLN